MKTALVSRQLTHPFAANTDNFLSVLVPEELASGVLAPIPYNQALPYLCSEVRNSLSFPAKLLPGWQITDKEKYFDEQVWHRFDNVQAPKCTKFLFCFASLCVSRIMFVSCFKTYAKLKQSPKGPFQHAHSSTSSTFSCGRR
jgi:hypothetical protein